MISSDIVWLLLGLALGFVIGRNKQPVSKIVVTDEKIQSELQIARNLNKSLLDDKHDLQEKLWKLQGKDPK
jgi:hypothetical protein